MSEKYFYLNSNLVIQSIDDLYNKIDLISEDDFNFHVNQERNDFAKWIKDVFSEEQLSTKIRFVKSKQQMRFVLAEFLNHDFENDENNKVSSQVIRNTSIEQSTSLVNEYLNKELQDIRKKEILDLSLQKNNTKKSSNYLLEKLALIVRRIVRNDK